MKSALTEWMLIIATVIVIIGLVWIMGVDRVEKETNNLDKQVETRLGKLPDLPNLPKLPDD